MGGRAVLWLRVNAMERDSRCQPFIENLAVTTGHRLGLDTRPVLDIMVYVWTMTIQG
jgi:hypothetical protein